MLFWSSTTRTFFDFRSAISASIDLRTDRDVRPET